jgi:hypothetical protein
MQYNVQKKKDKRTNNDLQSITYKIKDRVTRTPLSFGVRDGHELIRVVGLQIKRFSICFCKINIKQNVMLTFHFLQSVVTI